VPPDDRVVVFNPAAHWSFANALSNWNFKEGGEQALRKGYLGRIANAEIYMDQNIKAHQSGYPGTTGLATASYGNFMVTAALPGTVVRDGESAWVIQNFVYGTTKPALYAGDVFTVAGVFAVNPMSGESTGSLRCFIATTAATVTTVSTAKDTAVTAYPPVITAGPYATVNSTPAAAAVVTVFAPSGKIIPQNLAFHKNAFALVMVPLEVPDGAWSSSVTEDGFSIRVVKDYNIEVDSEIIRLDILYGVKTIYPELACRIFGAAQ
jgi:hypothetical protein